MIWHVAALVVGGARVAASARGSAEAGPRRARLSSDLAARLDAGSTGAVDVIVIGHGREDRPPGGASWPDVKKQLKSGAVFTVSRAALDALAQDREVDAVSGNVAGALAHGGDDRA